MEREHVATNGLSSRELPVASLWRACLARFDALHAEHEIEYDEPSSTILPLAKDISAIFRHCPWLRKKPVVPPSGPDTNALPPDPLEETQRNPFLDPDPRYLVSCPALDSIARPTHRLMINKFPVYRPQLLITTVAERSQTEDLDATDLAAAIHVLATLEASAAREFVVIYNCGRHSGNSQPHKHLQLFPKPAAEEPPLFPDQSVAESRRRKIHLSETAARLDAGDSGVWADDRMPFAHFLAYFPSPLALQNVPHSGVSPASLSQVTGLGELIRSYQALLNHSKNFLAGAGVPGVASYNVVLTRDWLLLIPRRAACGEETDEMLGVNGSISNGSGGDDTKQPVLEAPPPPLGPQVNSAGMVGLVWISNTRELEEWQRRGIAAHLAACGVPWRLDKENLRD